MCVAVHRPGLRLVLARRLPVLLDGAGEREDDDAEAVALRAEERLDVTGERELFDRGRRRGRLEARDADDRRAVVVDLLELRRDGDAAAVAQRVIAPLAVASVIEGAGDAFGNGAEG